MNEKALFKDPFGLILCSKVKTEASYPMKNEMENIL